MKKVLFVLGLALCSTFAMAQTNKVTEKVCKPTPVREKVALQSVKPSVDYKASIFTKDGEDVVLNLCDFHHDSLVTIDVIKATDRIDDTVVGSVNCHNRTEPSYRWHRIPDTAYVCDTTPGNPFEEDYASFINAYGRALLPRYMGVRNGIEVDNGFMMISLNEENHTSNALNTYFTMQPVSLQGSTVVDVTWRQLYAKYYDRCFLDYFVNNNWYAIEVNVTGIDVDINTLGSSYCEVTMPLAALSDASGNIQLRFRVYSNRTTVNSYGYGWAIDDVKIIAPSATSRWTFNRPMYLNGFYGTMPQGMTVPMSYSVYGRNIGSDNLDGVSFEIKHRDLVNSEWTNAFTVAQANTLPAGNPFKDYVLQINESGFMVSGLGTGDSVGYHSVPDMYDMYRTTDAELAEAGYLRRALPSENAGRNQFMMIASNAQGLVDTLAAYTYTVSEELEANPSFGRTVPGYRWGNDNGIVPAGSEFAWGFDGNFYTENSPHVYSPDYEVMTRYNTPSVIPVDENGEPWVIRGMELVSSTKVTADDAVGARFKVDMYRYEMQPGVDTGWFYWLRSNTGLSGQEVYLVGENNVAPSTDDLLDYATAEDGNYYAVNVFFPDQPALEPNTTFWLDYSLVGGGNYALCSQSYRYKSALGDFSENNNYTRYRDNADLAAYAGQFYPLNKYYDAYIYDPIKNSSLSGYYIEYYPLIRLIVGPKMEVTTHTVTGQCTEDENEFYDYWIYSNKARQAICGVEDTVMEGAVYSYIVLPGDPQEEGADHMEGNEDESYYIVNSGMDVIPSKVIDHIYINGEAINLNDSNIVTKVDYSVYWEGHTPLATAEERWAPALARDYYVIALRNITSDVTISADVRTVPLSIRNIEDNVNLVLAPNPATSQVRLNVAGFTGKAQCSILDMSGRVVYNADITSGETVINLNGVPAGAYFVRVTNDTFSKVEKLIVR